MRTTKKKEKRVIKSLIMGNGDVLNYSVQKIIDRAKEKYGNDIDLNDLSLENDGSWDDTEINAYYIHLETDEEFNTRIEFEKDLAKRRKATALKDKENRKAALIKEAAKLGLKIS